jgi:hypothetical protein
MPQIAEHKRLEKPDITGQSWQVAYLLHLDGLPQTGREQMVDHAFFQASDGKWRLWSQIRDTARGRVFLEWIGGETFESRRSFWTPNGICFCADKTAGESCFTGVHNDIIQAPHVLRDGDGYYLVYGGGPVDAEDTTRQICMAVSRDGVHFQRVANAQGQSRIAVGPGHCADNCLLKHRGTYYLFSGCSYFPNNGVESGVVVRTSPMLKNGGRWSDYTVVQSGGICGDYTHASQSVSVIHHEGMFYLFKMGWSDQFLTAVYASDNPFDFGVGDEKLISVLPVSAAEVIREGEHLYITTLQKNLDGISVSRLIFQ